MAYVYGETPPEIGYFFMLQVYDGVGILLNEVYERVGKSVISVCKKAQKDNSCILWLWKCRENILVLWFIRI